MVRFPVRLTILLFGTLLALSACNGDNRQAEGRVLAKVDGVSIHETELNRELRRFLGDRAERADSKVRRTVLESIVQKRAMVLAAEKELASEDSKDLEEQVARFRDNELIKFYMRNHTQPRPVTDEMVLAYYNAHRDRFGGAKVKRYRMLIGPVAQKANQEKADEMLQAFQVADDWSKLQQQAKSQGLQFRIQEGMADERMLHESLQAAMKALLKGETSDPITIGHYVYLVRITGKSEFPPKPLAEVRPEIRKLLAAETLKQNIRQASELSIGQVKVEYMGMGEGS